MGGKLRSVFTGHGFHGWLYWDLDVPVPVADGTGVSDVVRYCGQSEVGHGGSYMCVAPDPGDGWVLKEETEVAPGLKVGRGRSGGCLPGRSSFPLRFLPHQEAGTPVSATSGKTHGYPRVAGYLWKWHTVAQFLKG